MTTLIGTVGGPRTDPSATLVEIDEATITSRTPTTILLSEAYYPLGADRIGFRYSAAGLRDGESVKNVVTLPDVEAAAIIATGLAVVI